jgi:type III polyketide synthase
MHPKGASILSEAEWALGITPQHMRASYDIYVNHGNSSSASIYRVMHRLRSMEMDPLAPGGRVRDYVVACAFGPGITVAMRTPFGMYLVRRDANYTSIKSLAARRL